MELAVDGGYNFQVSMKMTNTINSTSRYRCPIYTNPSAVTYHEIKEVDNSRKYKMLE